MSRCLPGAHGVILDEEELLAWFVDQQDCIQNITPNGLIVPKRHTVLEYNALVRAFIAIIDELNIQGRISSWHIPLNLRIKYGPSSLENLGRSYPTEEVHTDSWAGESSDSVTTMLFIFGDVARNHVRYYDPPGDFQETWIGPLPSYAHGAPIAQKYSLLDYIPERGNLVLGDFATCHASTHLPDAGPRVSIDTTFALKRHLAPGEAERIHPWRVDERASHQVLAGLGETHLFFFPDTLDEMVDNRGGFKHPTNLQLIELER
jgi:hypothetical protein